MNTGREENYPNTPAPIRIGFIGAGKVGQSLGRHIVAHGGERLCVSGYYSRNTADAEKAAGDTGGCAFAAAAELAARCDFLLLTVPDDEIAAVWEALKPTLSESRENLLCVGHCSGCLDAQVFGSPPLRAKIAFGSIHPLVAIYDQDTAYKKLEDAFFTLEGDEVFTRRAAEILDIIGNNFHILAATPDAKAVYHAASVMVSNFVCALAYLGMSHFKLALPDSEFVENAWRTLFFENAENIVKSDPVRALTGPIERGDAATVRRHLEVLTGDAREIYLRLSRILADAAQDKNPSRDYAPLRLLLEKADAPKLPAKERPILRTTSEAHAFAAAAHTDGKTLGLIPTMGALHEGHLSLIRRSAAENDSTLVSIFVNPIQFDDPLDLAVYPKTLSADAGAAFEAGADAVFAPSVREMYPDGFSTFIDMTGVTERLCGAARPSHFRGVLTVVGKLFCMFMPDRAYFGEKDAQQLAVVKKMTSELSLHTTIIPCETLREADGLAMSSRNTRLDPDERRAAGGLFRVLREAKKLFDTGESDPAILCATLRSIQNDAQNIRIDYAEIVDANTLEPVTVARTGDLLMLAAYIGATRLIDNLKL